MGSEQRRLLRLTKTGLFARDGEYISTKMVGVDVVQFALRPSAFCTRSGSPKCPEHGFFFGAR